MSEQYVIREGRGNDLPIFIHSDLDDLPLTVEGFRVYAHLARRAGKYGEAWPSYASMGETCFRKTYPNASGDTLRRKAIAAVKELVDLGLITKGVNLKDDGSRSSNSYTLTQRSEWGGGVNTLPSVNTPGVVSSHQGGVIAPKDTPINNSPSFNNHNDDDAFGAVIKAYEENIGMITEHIGEQLGELVDEVGHTSTIKGILAACEAGKRNFRYARACAVNHANGTEPPVKHRKPSYQASPPARKGYSMEAYLEQEQRVQYSQWST